MEVVACTVDIKPSSKPNLSLTTLAKGAKQLVVHDAFETTVKSAVYFVWLTPMTNIGVESFGGAEMMTFLQPPPICLPADSPVVKTPVDSHT